MIRPVLLTIFWCFLFPGHILGSDAVIDLKKNAMVGNDMVILADLAEISGKNVMTLSRIPIMKAPEIRSGITLSAGTIANKVRAEYRGQVDFRGAEQVLIKPRLVEVSKEAIEKEFIEQVISRNPWKDTGTIVIEQVRVPRCPVIRDAGPLSIQANFSPHEDYLGLLSANVLISSGTALEKVTVSGRVKLMADVPVVRTKIRTGAMINPSDIVLKKLDISSYPQQLCTNPGDCVGKRAKATLLEGKPIKVAQIERKPDVCSGDVVMIEARVNDLVVTDKGVALKDGYQGEPIPVKNVSSGKQVVGTIIAAALVQVEM